MERCLRGASITLDDEDDEDVDDVGQTHTMGGTSALLKPGTAPYMSGRI